MTRLSRLLAHFHSHRFLVASLLDRSERLAVVREAHLASLRENARLRDELAAAREVAADLGRLAELRGLDSADLEWLHEIEER